MVGWSGEGRGRGQGWGGGELTERRDPPPPHVAVASSPHSNETHFKGNAPESANFQADSGAFGCPRVGGSLAFSIFVAPVSGKSPGISPILLGMIGTTKLSQFGIPSSEFQATKFQGPLGAGTTLVLRCVGQFPRWGQATLTEGVPPPQRGILL